MVVFFISDVGYQIEHCFLCPILLHDDMPAALYRRHKVSYSDPLSPRASSCLVGVLVKV